MRFSRSTRSCVTAMSSGIGCLLLPTSNDARNGRRNRPNHAGNDTNLLIRYPEFDNLVVYDIQTTSNLIYFQHPIHETTELAVQICDRFPQPLSKPGEVLVVLPLGNLATIRLHIPPLYVAWATSMIN